MVADPSRRFEMSRAAPDPAVRAVANRRTWLALAIVAGLFAVVPAIVRRVREATPSAPELRLYPAPRELPDLTFAGPQGAPTSLTAFRGRIVLLNVWATWCPPCRREMPALQRAQAANPDVNIVFVNQGEDARTIVAFLDRQGLALRNVLVDPQNSVGAALGHSGLPTTLFFDAQGRLADTRIGELSQATLAQRLARIRAASPPTR